MYRQKNTTPYKNQQEILLCFSFTEVSEQNAVVSLTRPIIMDQYINPVFLCTGYPSQLGRYPTSYKQSYTVSAGCYPVCGSMGTEEIQTDGR